MQEALRFDPTAAEPVTRADFLEQARARRRHSEVRRGLSLTIRGLHKSFGDNAVLRGVDLHIPAGQFVAIVGRSGCGKSTLLRLIAGLESADEGTMSVGGETRREDIRVMFQEPETPALVACARQCRGRPWPGPRIGRCEGTCGGGSR